MINRLREVAKKFGFVFSTFFTIAVIVIFHFTRFGGLKLYPVVVNSAIFWLFFSSLFQKETIIQKFAKLAEGELKEPVKIYTRRLTYIWCAFLFVQLAISVITCFLPDKIWMIYNGFLFYIFLGAFFAIEYLVRIVFKRKNCL